MPQVPQGRVTDQIAEIWSEVLGVPDPAHDSTFFDLGGHSLLAIRVMARVQERFGVDLPLAALFQHPTVNEFRRYLGSVLADLNNTAVGQGEEVATPGETSQASLEPLLTKLDQLTDAEAAQLLALLEEDGGGGGS